QEHNAVIVLGGRQVNVYRMLQILSQLGQFKIVGGKQRVTANFLRQVLGGGPGQRKAVEGAGAAAHFIHQYQAVLGGVVQDVGSFGHFHHERRAAAGNVVGRAHSGENPVHRPQNGTIGGNKAAGVGEQGDQGGLAHIRGFTTHVRAGDYQHAALLVDQQVVRNEGLVQQLLHDRVAPLFHFKAGLAGEFR